jgi:hypothetical protein
MRRVLADTPKTFEGNILAGLLENDYIEKTMN